MGRSFARVLVAAASVAALGLACAKPARQQPAAASGAQSAPARALETVYFDYDRAEIRSDAKPLLRANAQELGASASWRKLVLHGHCDDRGSEEYNLALGERRAKAVKRYLVGLGVPASKVEVLSYGESQPAAHGSGESAWQRNRRVEFALAR